MFGLLLVCSSVSECFREGIIINFELSDLIVLICCYGNENALLQVLRMHQN